ncbi:NnrS family protein [uncultured Sphingosinicella sp.]|uniref:NnrS family protein n=1 Tax=uncultured Sphingosinicella sp. TaxID=478748 RepID=UPI0030D81168
MTESNEIMTRGERMLAMRKSRMAAAPPFLRGGFRPFFFGGPLWAVIALALWLFAFLGGLELPSAFDALSWHRHEMLFGFVGAIIAGFLLTAIPNWTGRLPIAGWPLATLFASWLAGRLALLWSQTVGLALAAVLDVGFYVVFALIAGREVIAAKNRNLPVVAMVMLFGLADAADYAAVSGLILDGEAGFRAGIALVVLIISLIGGRIIPSFTRNWMTKQGMGNGLPTQPGRFDQVVIALTTLALLGWVLAPSAMATGAALCAAGALQLVRLARWRGWRTLPDPIVLVLHGGYLWVPVGLLLLGWSILDIAVPRTAALHALTAGAMATMILAVMTRATLGHTGRALKADAATVFVYVFVTLGALLRVAASLGFFESNIGMAVAGAFWGGAFILFLLAYGTKLFAPRLDEKL